MPFKWFDKFEQSFLSLLATQQMLTERLSTTENITTEHEQWIYTLQTSVVEFQEENKRLCTKLTDFKGESGNKKMF